MQMYSQEGVLLPSKHTYLGISFTAGNSATTKSLVQQDTLETRWVWRQKPKFYFLQIDLCVSFASVARVDLVTSRHLMIQAAAAATTTEELLMAS